MFLHLSVCPREGVGCNDVISSYGQHHPPWTAPPPPDSTSTPSPDSTAPFPPGQQVECLLINDVCNSQWYCFRI